MNDDNDFVEVFNLYNLRFRYKNYTACVIKHDQINKYINEYNLGKKDHELILHLNKDLENFKIDHRQFLIIGDDKEYVLMSEISEIISLEEEGVNAKILLFKIDSLVPLNFISNMI